MRRNLVKTVNVGKDESGYLLEYYLLEREYCDSRVSPAPQKRYGFCIRKTWDSGVNSCQSEYPFVTDSLESSISFIDAISNGTVTPTTLSELITDYFYYDEEINQHAVDSHAPRSTDLILRIS